MPRQPVPPWRSLERHVEPTVPGAAWLLLRGARHLLAQRSERRMRPSLHTTELCAAPAPPARISSTLLRRRPELEMLLLCHLLPLLLLLRL